MSGSSPRIFRSSGPGKCSPIGCWPKGAPGSRTISWKRPRTERLDYFLLPTHELAFLRQDFLFRRVEFLVSLIQSSFLLLEFLLTSAKALFTADDRIAFVRERGPLLFHHPAVLFQLRGIVGLGEQIFEEEGERTP